MTYEDIAKANSTIQTTPIKKKDKKTGEVKVKDYAEVAQRVKAFRMVYPTGYIHTHFYDLKDGVCTMMAECGYYSESGAKIELATGTAQEKEGSSFINEFSYIENCETSAVGRCLGLAGFGIDAAVCSAEELQVAIENQEKNPMGQVIYTEERKATPKQVEVLAKIYTGENLVKLLDANSIERLEDLPMKKASDLISKLSERKG